MTIVPDTKDWTWVLRQPCPECGFDTSAYPREQVGALLRANAASWLAVLAGDAVPGEAVPGGAASGDVRERPRPETWSPLEYACHVRDVFSVFAYRLNLMLTEEDPLFANWDQDATAVAERYSEQDPAAVAPALAASAEALAAAFDAVADHADAARLWLRPARRSDGAAFTVETLARYLVHDPVHHLWDVTGVPAR